MLIYYSRVDLDQGFKVMEEPKGSRLVCGKSVSLPSGAKLFQHMRSSGTPMKCWSCGVEASCFIVNKGSNDRVGPAVLDLYAETRDGPILMTRDHIIPKSYGGVNEVANLRIGCGPCNHTRGNELEADDIEFMRTHHELIRSDAKYKLEDNVTFVAKTSSGPIAKEKINQEDAAANKKAKAKAKRQRQKAKRKVKAEQPYITMMALALA